MDFNRLLADFAALTGLEAAPDEKDSCTLETDGLAITIKYRQDTDDVIIFAPVTDPEIFETLEPQVLSTALKLAYNGAGTRGNHIGLSEGDELILSRILESADLDGEKLFHQLLNFADAASYVRNTLRFSKDAPGESGSFGDSGAPVIPGADARTFMIV